MEKLYEIASYASFIVYHIEAMDKIKIPKTMIREYINLQKTVGSFPEELNYVSSFYDVNTGSSVTLFENMVEESKKHPNLQDLKDAQNCFSNLLEHKISHALA